MSRELGAPNQGAEPPRAMRCHSAQNASATFADADRLYVAQGGEDRLIEECHQIFDGMQLSEITQEVIDRWARILCPHVELSTLIREYYVPLAAILHFAASLSLCRYLRIRRPPVTKAHRLRWIWPAESIQLAENCCSHFRPLYLFMQHTGADADEAVYLDWRKISLARREVNFHKTKSANDRDMPLHPRLVAALERLPDGQGRVFRRTDGAGYTKSRRPANAFKTALARALSRAGIEDFTYRDIRTTYCMWRLALDRNADLLYDLGGRDVRMIEKYKHVSTADLDALRMALRDLGWDSAPLIAAPVRR
jgi:integrase